MRLRAQLSRGPVNKRVNQLIQWHLTEFWSVWGSGRALQTKVSTRGRVCLFYVTSTKSLLLIEADANSPRPARRDTVVGEMGPLKHSFSKSPKPKLNLEAFERRFRSASLIDG